MILVAGGTGFAGSAIVRELVRRGERVRVLSRGKGGVARKFPGLEVDAAEGDVTRPDSLPPAFEGVDAVIGCQQLPGSPIENPKRGWTFEAIDEGGTRNLLAAAREAGVKRYVYLSGASADPAGRYHWLRAKGRAEEAVKASGVPFVILRPSWIYGPEDHSLNRLLQMSRRLPFAPVIGDGGRQQLQPLFIDDIGRAVAQAVRLPEAENRTFEIGGPDVLSMDDVMRLAMQAAGFSRPILHGPKPIMNLAAWFLQYVPGRPLTPDAVDFVSMDALADNSALLATFDITLTPFREGLANYLKTVDSQGK